MSLPALLKHSRHAKRVSQLDLALRLGVSARHVSFLESGKARPSRALLLAWMREVEAPRALCNAALLHAGFASGTGVRGPARGVPGIGLTPAREKNPLMVVLFDADWQVVEMNDRCRWLCALLMPSYWATLDPHRPMDMIAGLMHPQGFLAQVQKPREVARAMLGQVRASLWARPSLAPRVEALEAALAARYGPFASDSGTDEPTSHLDLTFDTAKGVLSFYTLQSVVGIPQDVTPASLRMELWFPADDATRAVLDAYDDGAR